MPRRGRRDCRRRARRAPLAQAATLVADPVWPATASSRPVFLPGAGFTPNAQVVFTRDGQPLIGRPRSWPTAAGAVSAKLTLPGLLKGQQHAHLRRHRLGQPALTAAVSLLVTATDVDAATPSGGAPDRLLTIRARGFFGGGKSLWAHVDAPGRGTPARNVQDRAHQGRRASRSRRKQAAVPVAAPRPGTYRVQFDTFRRYRRASAIVKTEFNVTIFRTVRPAIARPARGRPGPADPAARTARAPVRRRTVSSRARPAGGGTTRRRSSPPSRSAPAGARSRPSPPRPRTTVPRGAARRSLRSPSRAMRMRKRALACAAGRAARGRCASAVRSRAAARRAGSPRTWTRPGRISSL